MCRLQSVSVVPLAGAVILTLGAPAALIFMASLLWAILLCVVAFGRWDVLLSVERELFPLLAMSGLYRCHLRRDDHNLAMRQLHHGDNGAISVGN